MFLIETQGSIYLKTISSNSELKSDSGVKERDSEGGMDGDLKKRVKESQGRGLRFGKLSAVWERLGQGAGLEAGERVWPFLDETATSTLKSFYLLSNIISLRSGQIFADFLKKLPKGKSKITE